VLEIELKETLVINKPCKIRDTVFTVTSPAMLHKPVIEMPSLALHHRLEDVSFKRVVINCNGIASGIAAADLQGCIFEDLHINSPRGTGLYFVGQKNSFQGCTVRRLRIWGGDTANYGLILDGQFEPINSNVAFCVFETVYIRVGSGKRGIEIRDADNCKFDNVLIECANKSSWALNCVERGNNSFINFDPTMGRVIRGQGNHFYAWSTLNGGSVEDLRKDMKVPPQPQRLEDLGEPQEEGLIK